MDITFKTKKLQKVCNNKSHRIRKLGDQLATRLGLRLDDLKAAETLQDVSSLPPTRCHELKGDRAGQLAIDLSRPLRLIFEPCDPTIKKKADGGLDKEAITSICILEIVDYHGK